MSQYVEFVDPDTLAPVKKGEIGELVVTGLSKKHMPIIRYRVGDLGRWVMKPCACGRKEPLFEILGRCDDRIHVGGAHVFVGDLARAVAAVPGLSPNFQVVVSTRGHSDHFRLRVERSGASAVRPGVQAELLAAMRANCDIMAECLDMKWFDAPEIEVLEPGAIERVRRTGKIRRVVDERIRR